jgi:hypothetical protein
MIAALYVEAGGCYANLEGVDPWDETRDARLYAGPHPVVAHPPCQRWGRFWHGSTRRPHQYALGDDGGCFEAALASVRRYGGVLEHPADSKAWRWHGLNAPARSGGWVAADGVPRPAPLYCPQLRLGSRWSDPTAFPLSQERPHRQTRPGGAQGQNTSAGRPGRQGLVALRGLFPNTGADARSAVLPRAWGGGGPFQALIYGPHLPYIKKNIFFYPIYFNLYYQLKKINKSSCSRSPEGVNLPNGRN